MANLSSADHRAIADKLTDQRFPNKAGVQGTHWSDCHHAHSECAYYLGVLDALQQVAEGNTRYSAPYTDA